MKNCVYSMAAKLWCVTAICLSAASKWALAILISRCQKCVIVAALVFVLLAHYCHLTSSVLAVLKNCCRGCISKVFPRETISTFKNQQNPQLQIKKHNPSN